jgi:hypothetical protein
VVWLASTLGCAADASGDPLAPFAPGLAAEGSDFEALHCNAAGAWDPMPHLSPSQPFEYQALVREVRQIGTPDEPAIVSEAGASCTTDAAPAFCAEVLSPFSQAQDWISNTQLGSTWFRVSTVLDGETRHASTLFQLLDFLGPIDSPEEALLVAFHHGYGLGHGDDLCRTAAVRPIEDGYEVFGTLVSSHCNPIRITRFLLHVSRSGTLTALRSAVASETDACA